MKNMSFYICCFFFYSLFGWLYEVFLEVVIYQWGFTNRGMLFGPYCPIYGFGALLLIFAVYGLIKDKDIKTKIIRSPQVFILCALIATAVELLASYLCEAVVGYWPWQTYVDYAINFEGRIALSPSIRFGLGGMLFLYILQPVFEKFLKDMKTKKLATAIVIVMSFDLLMTVAARMF